MQVPGSWRGTAARQPAVALLAAAAVSLLCGLFVQTAGLAIATAIAVLTAAGVAWPWIALRGIRCRVRFQRKRGCEGQPVPVALTITNAWPWPVWGLTLHRGFGLPASDLAAELPVAAVARVGGWSTSQFSWEFRPACRGEYPLETPRIATGFPFGLWQSRRLVEVESRVLIRPQSFTIRSIVPARGADHTGAALSESRAGDAGDVLGTRPYRRGDSLRRIHWAQTARHGKLIISERQAASRAAAHIIVDADEEVHGGSGAGSSLQWTLRIAASLCQGYAQRRALVRCLIGRKTVHVSGEGPEMEMALDVMARVPLAGFTAGAAACPPFGSRASPCTQEIVITTDVGLRRWQASAGTSPAGRAGGQRKFVVLRAGAFSETGLQEHQGGRQRATPDQSCVRIDGSQNVPGEFRDQWETVSL